MIIINDHHHDHDDHTQDVFFSVVLCIPVLPVGFFVFATSLVRLRHYRHCCLYHYYHHYHHHKVCVIIVIIVVGFLGSIIYLRKVVYTIISIIIILLAIESTLWLWLFAMIVYHLLWSSRYAFHRINITSVLYDYLPWSSRYACRTLPQPLNFFFLVSRNSDAAKNIFNLLGNSFESCENK